MYVLYIMSLRSNVVVKSSDLFGLMYLVCHVGIIKAGLIIVVDKHYVTVSVLISLTA